MINKIIHIPHSSTHIPKHYLNDYLIPYDELKNECLLMSDIYTDILITDNKYGHDIITFPFSRIFCDVERFNDDTEEMNKIGMGVLYTHSHDLKEIRKISNKEDVLQYYNNYHDLLNITTEMHLNKHSKVLFIDLHTYSVKPLKYELHKNLKRPDVCLGINDYHSNKTLNSKVINIIKKYNLSVEINQPFKGCLIPSNYYNKNKNVFGIMLEINKRLFPDKFEIVKEMLDEILKI